MAVLLVVAFALCATLGLTALALTAAWVAAVPAYGLVARERVELYTGSLIVVLTLAHIWTQAASTAAVS